MDTAKGIECPHCGGTDHIVSDSRAATGSRHRRRTCVTCRRRFSTVELLQATRDAELEELAGYREAFATVQRLSVA